MNNQLNSINSIESGKHLPRSQRFVENAKRAVGKVLTKAWIGLNTILPMASTTTSTFMPASVNTISVVAPTASTVIKAISLWTAASLLTACGGSEDGPDGPIDVKDTTAPTINISKYEVDISWWKQIRISGNQLYIWSEVVASWNDNKTRNCSVLLLLNWKTITSGTTISEEWTLTIKVSDEAWNIKSSDIRLNKAVDQDISWLENLKNLNMQVDQEVNLLNWVTFGNGASLEKVEIEIDWQRVEVSDPYHYIPPYPWVCNIIITVKDKNGKSTEYKVDNLTIKALEYKEASIDNANMIQEKYPRYNNLQQTTKDFIYPHLIASYAACNRSKQDDRVHIIMWETTDASDVENIWQYNDPSDHAYEWYYRIRALSPEASIKWCNDFRFNLEEYVKQHPDKIYIISCAAGSDWWWNREEYNENPATAPQRRLLENENVIIIWSVWNVMTSYRKTYNENIKDWNNYRVSSTNSKKNNKISVSWYNSWSYKNYFSPAYREYWWLKSTMPVWFDKNKWNIVMPMIPLISSKNNEDTNTSSSYPTAVTSGVIWNAVSIIMTTHPWLTAEDAMTIIVNNYLKREKFQYKDETTNRELVDGDYRYFIDMQKLLKTELLQSDKIDKINLNSDLVELPSGNWICYTGKWIQFEYNWKKYNVTYENQSILNQALKTWNVKWYWHKDSFKKYWWTNSANFDTYVVDKNWKKIPDTHLNITKDVIYKIS